MKIAATAPAAEASKTIITQNNPKQPELPDPSDDGVFEIVYLGREIRECENHFPEVGEPNIEYLGPRGREVGERACNGVGIESKSESASVKPSESFTDGEPDDELEVEPEDEPPPVK